MSPVLRTFVVAVCISQAEFSWAAPAAAPQNPQQMAERLQKPLARINLPASSLKERIVALRGITEPLGIELSFTKGVKEAGDRIFCPAIALEGESLFQLLSHMCEDPLLKFGFGTAEVNLLLAAEIPKKNPSQQEDKNQ